MCYKKLSTIFCQRLRRTGSPGGAFAAGSASNQGVEMSEPNQATPPPRTPGPGSGAHCCWESTGTAGRWHHHHHDDHHNSESSCQPVCICRIGWQSRSVPHQARLGPDSELRVRLPTSSLPVARAWACRLRRLHRDCEPQ